MKIINLTSGPVTVTDDTGKTTTYPPNKPHSYVSKKVESIGEIDGFDLTEPYETTVHNLPPEDPDTILIVSRPVFEAAGRREDLVCPGKAIRDKAGKIVACLGFAR
jgi:hypothetical protein